MSKANKSEAETQCSTPSPDAAAPSVEGLIARLEAADGRNRELDCAIADVVHPLPVGANGPDWRLISKTGCQFHLPTCAREYTDALDDAMTLMPDRARVGCLGQWWVDRPGGWFCNVMQWEHGDFGNVIERAYMTGFEYENASPTAAIALCIAALKARAAQHRPFTGGRQMTEKTPSTEPIADTADEWQLTKIRKIYRGAQGDMSPFGDVLVLLCLLDEGRVELAVEKDNVNIWHRNCLAEQDRAINAEAELDRLRQPNPASKIFDHTGGFNPQCIENGCQSLRQPAPEGDTLKVAQVIADEIFKWPGYAFIDGRVAERIAAAITAAAQRARREERELRARWHDKMQTRAVSKGQYVLAALHEDAARRIRALPDTEE